MKILIIDDSCEFTEPLSEILLTRGYSVEIIYDADTILDNIYHVDMFDIVLLDIMLLPPEKYESTEIEVGIYILKKIREISNIPIILNSAIPYSMMKDHISNFGNISYISKSMVPTDLINLLNAMKR